MDPALLVANHISWLETIAIGSIFPTRFLAKNELRRWPLIGSLTALSGTLFIHRGSRRALQRSQTTISQALSEGQRVMVFPEGTTTDGSSVGRFRPALFETARSAGCPIQPIAISYRSAQRSDPIAPYIDDDKFVPHLWRVLKRGNTHVHLHFCQPLHSRETRQTLADICQARISLAVSNFPQTMRVATPSTTQIDPSQESSTPPWPHLSKTAGRHD